MKKLKIYLYFIALLMFGVSCEQELVDNSSDPCPSDDPSIICPQAEEAACPPGASAGSANFSKFVALGTSYTAGFQAGALFNEGQNNSLPKILADQFSCVGGGAFNQPSINAVLGYNIFFTPNPGSDNRVLGRMLLQGASPRPTPQPHAVGDLSAAPNPQVNPGFIYTGNKAALNNFSVQAILLKQVLTPAAGNWAAPNTALGFTPFYARFASAPGTSTILGDAALAGGSFFMFWMGMDDYLLHAAFGADPSKAPLTPEAGGVGVGFTATYNYVLGQLLASNPNSKGVIANFPSVFALPHFTSVPWNAIVFTASDQAKIDGANAGYATYNGALSNPLFGLSEGEINKRKINFKVGANGIVIEDETLTNLTAFGVPSIRQATSADIFPLSAGNVLGTEATPGNPASTWGVGKALTDQYALIPSEIMEIEGTRLAFNAAIKAAADANSSRVALADVNAAFNTFLANRLMIANGITITPNINPPTGIYSEDGLHPNNRGYAFVANIFIDAINAKFGASVPKVNLAKYSATALPIP